MKKMILTLLMILAVSGCNSISAEGEHGSITIKDKDHSYSNTKKSNGNAYGHNNPKNPHYRKN